VCISGSNAGYTKFRGSEGYWLSTLSVSFPFTSPPVRHRVPSHFNWTPQDHERCYSQQSYLPSAVVTPKFSAMGVHRLATPSASKVWCTSIATYMLSPAFVLVLSLAAKIKMVEFFYYRIYGTLL
jgi:hypothetical protein